MVKDALNVLFLSPEVVPFAKSGGLADVAGSLPIALKYGTVPVVRATGGLDDTIVPYDDKTKKGNGFKFSTYGTDAFLGAIRQAMDLYTDSDAWKDLITNNMKEDFSWDRSARSYL